MFRHAGCLVLWAWASQTADAAVFTPEEFTRESPFPFVIKPGPNGRVLADPMPLNLFRLRLGERETAANRDFPEFTELTVEGQVRRLPNFKGLAVARVQQRLPNAGRLNADELTALTGDLLRLGRTSEAIDLLAPKLRDRAPDYRLVSNLVFALAANNDWDAAADRHNLLLVDLEPPSTVPGLTDLQLKWWLQLDRDMVRRWLQIRRQIAQRPPSEQSPGETTEVYPLFVDEQRRPLVFANASGVYEPGQLAAAERAKLPPDAIAAVQQLILWMPADSMLLWLLAELYAADGQFQEAVEVFDLAISARALSKIRLLREHRVAVRAAYDQIPRPTIPELGPTTDPAEATPDEPQEKGLFAVVGRTQFWIVAGVFGLGFCLLVWLQARSIWRRARGACGPVG